MKTSKFRYVRAETAEHAVELLYGAGGTAHLSKVGGQVGRRQTPKEVRELIFRMAAENPTWGAPGIHGELLMLGFDIPERTISWWMKRAPRDTQPAKRWLTFLRSYREAMAAMDFFTVPTITFGVLY
jgi:hypothetical protein